MYHKLVLGFYERRIQHHGRENLVQMYHKLVLGFYEHHGRVKHAVNLVQMYHQAGVGGFLSTGSDTTGGK